MSTDSTVQKDTPAANPTPADIVQRDDEVRRVRQAVDALPDGLRAPLMLVRFEGMRYREAAEVLGISLGAMRMRIHRAHLALVAALTQ